MLTLAPNMATLHSLKQVLRKKAAAASPSTQPISDLQYSAGFNTLLQGPGWTTYQDFIIPQLSQLLAPLFNSRTGISVLEVGPGPRSVLGYLPARLRQKVRRYAALEPNDIFAASLQEWLCSTPETEGPLPCLESPPDIHRARFTLDGKLAAPSGAVTGDDGKYDVILFCHSMYGMKPKRKFIERALGMLAEQPEGGMVVVFHRDGTLHPDGLVCHRTASFPAGVVSVVDDDDALDSFASFIAGFVMEDVDEAIRLVWRKACRALGRREEAQAGHLLFSAPNVMAAFTRHATALPELTAQMPLATGDKTVKNREARLHRSAAVVRPTEISHVQACVQWALEHRVGLAIVGGGHSGHCLQPNVVSVDLGAFDKIHILAAGADDGDPSSDSGPLVVAGAGCKTGDIIAKTMAADLTVPLGARPSVGAGLWLQGGIGHLTRLYGLACDAIVGAVLVSPDSGRVLYVGRVPSQHRPAGAVRSENDDELLWAIKGAGNNFGIVMGVTFKAYPAPTYSIRNWVVPLSDHLAALSLSRFNSLLAGKLSRDCSSDAYLYWEAGQLHLGVTTFESSTAEPTTERSTLTTMADTLWGKEKSSKTMDGVGVFEAEMYMSVMHGGHASGKTSSFKRCLFLKQIGGPNIRDRLVAAVKSRPSPLCYLHLLQGGGAISDVPADATAFGCRDWDFACVITSVWPRHQDGTEVARAAVQWVYDVAADLLPHSSGAYGADLGPDPRDAALAARAFGPNRPRLARLKRTLDPRNVLAYACRLPEVPMEPKLIVLITGKHGAGKDYCAEVWASVFATYTQKNLTARVMSISEATKRAYAVATGADVDRLLQDRAYKEQHRPELTKFFQDQLRQRPRLSEEEFLSVVYGATNLDVLLITGMRDEAPVAALAHLVPDSRLLEVRVLTSEEKRKVGRGCGDDDDDGYKSRQKDVSMSDAKAQDYRPCFTFENDTSGSDAARKFAEYHLLPFINEDLQRLASMVRLVSDFPRPGIDFRHILDIAQQPGGLALCTSLLQSRLDWAKVSAIATCQTGGFIFASALSLRVNVPLKLIREAAKLPPPTVSTAKSPSHISSSTSTGSRIEMERGGVRCGASVVVVDDVLATGETLCAALGLLGEAGVGAEDVFVLVVAEFPAHRGREMLRRRGFGRVRIQSLLVFGGA